MPTPTALGSLSGFKVLRAPSLRRSHLALPPVLLAVSNRADLPRRCRQQPRAPRERDGADAEHRRTHPLRAPRAHGRGGSTTQAPMRMHAAAARGRRCAAEGQRADRQRQRPGDRRQIHTGPVTARTGMKDPYVFTWPRVSLGLCSFVRAPTRPSRSQRGALSTRGALIAPRFGARLTTTTAGYSAREG